MELALRAFFFDCDQRSIDDPSKIAKLILPLDLDRPEPYSLVFIDLDLFMDVLDDEDEGLLLATS